MYNERRVHGAGVGGAGRLSTFAPIAVFIDTLPSVPISIALIYI